jgi:hypothetical protein
MPVHLLILPGFTDLHSIQIQIAGLTAPTRQHTAGPIPMRMQIQTITAASAGQVHILQIQLRPIQAAIVVHIQAIAQLQETTPVHNPVCQGGLRAAVLRVIAAQVVPALQAIAVQVVQIATAVLPVVPTQEAQEALQDHIVHPVHRVLPGHIQHRVHQVVRVAVHVQADPPAAEDNFIHQA